MKTHREAPEEPVLSHHQQPKCPGSDCDHTHDEEILKDKRRVWEERHRNGNSSPNTE